MLLAVVASKMLVCYWLLSSWYELPAIFKGFYATWSDL